MFGTNFTRILDRLSEFDRRLGAIESGQQELLRRLDSMDREAQLRSEVERLKEQRQSLADQGLQLVEQLEAARRELREATTS